MNYEQSVAWISGLKRYGIKLGLGRFIELSHRMGDPHLAFKSAHVAGTNGKGSVTSMLAEACQSAGMKTGRYLSPYVFDLRERIQIGGEMIRRNDFARLASKVLEVVEAVEQTEHGQATEFEVKTLIGFLYFAEQSVDFACVEVGLGGRLDATNVVNPEVSVITSISYDHMDRLGDTLTEIASEKAGIIKPGVAIVSGATGSEASKVINRKAVELGCTLINVAPWSARSSIFHDANVAFYHAHPDRDSFDIVSGNWELSSLRPRLQGRFQAANSACAAAAMLQLRKQGFSLGDDDIRAGIERAWLPGRMQTLSEAPLVIADGAHNPAGAEALSEHLARQIQQRSLILIVGMTKPHDPVEFLAALLPHTNWLIVTEPPVANAWHADEIVRCIEDFDGKVSQIEDVGEAVRVAYSAARPAPETVAVCITGSFYLVGAIPEGYLHLIRV